MHNNNKIIKSQQEALKSLGLYSGPVDGDWGLRSKLAMMGLKSHRAFAGVLIHKHEDTFFKPFCQLPEGWAWGEDADGDAIVVFDKEILDKLEAEKAEATRLAEIEKAETAKVEADFLEMNNIQANADAETARLAEEKRIADGVAAAELAAKFNEVGAPQDTLDTAHGVLGQDADQINHTQGQVPASTTDAVDATTPVKSAEDLELEAMIAADEAEKNTTTA